MSKQRKDINTPWIPLAAVLLVAVLLPLLVFGIAEAGLRIAGYGVSSDLFVESGIPDHYSVNPEYYRMYHPRTVASSTDLRSQYRPVLIQQPKPENVYRIFILGGSTAKGFPYMDKHSFADIAGVLLNSRLDDRRVEVINLGRSAMSSYYVRDTARRIWDWDPDLVLVYSGHNEYFGTVGAGSGGGHLRKLVYMRLKSLRSFQWLFNIMNPPDRDVDPDDPPMTLMAERLAEGHFPPDPEFDATVAERFIDNIDTVRQQAERHNTPIIVMEPVSNLVTMPPFDGQHSDELQDLIDRGIAVVTAAGDASQEDRIVWRNAVAEEPLARESSHLLYLTALDAARNDGARLADFTAARDADTIPFRARGILQTTLGDWAEPHADTVHYLPLQDELAELHGAMAFSDNYFIDHLHFSHAGHLLVGRLTADAIVAAQRDSLGITTTSWPPAQSIEQRLQYHPALDASALLTMRELIRNPPFRDMLIPYQGLGVRAGLQRNPLMQNEGLAERLQEASPDEALQIVGEYYYQNEQWQEFLQFLNALLYVNPGNYNAHYNIADFMDRTGSTRPQILGAYQRAYLLSGRDDDIRARMEAFAERAGLDQHGRPLQPSQ